MLCFSALKDAPVGGSSAGAQDVSGGDQREEGGPRESRKALRVPLCTTKSEKWEEASKKSYPKKTRKI